MTHCCETMKQAQQLGTDSEGYGPAVCEGYDDNVSDCYVGTIEKPFKMCPWCGEALPQPEVEK